MERCLAAKPWVGRSSPDLSPLFCTQLPPTPLPSNPELHNIFLDKNLMRGQVTRLKERQVGLWRQADLGSDSISTLR